MPLTFAEAYAIVCPDGRTVTPTSKDAQDILALMKQSGYKHFTETVVQESAPRIPRNEMEAQRFIESPLKLRQLDGVESVPFVSRKQWMSVEANKQAFIKALNKNNTTS